MRAIDCMLEMLVEHGVSLLFGNPGTSELPLNDALFNFPQLQYILGLQEIPVMAMADGYAQASGTLGVVNLHISCGVGNAMGMLYNAYRENTPLLVTAGQTDRRLMVEEPILWGELVRVVEPWTKWAYELQRAEDLPRVLRRAVRTALTPPTGPVFLSLPMDLQQEWVEGLRAVPIELPSSRVRPPVDDVARAVELLAAAQAPAILAGSRVAQRDAVGELVRVAEQVGATVFGEPLSNHGRMGFPCHHPLYAGSLPLWAPEIHATLAPYDVLLVTGMDLLRQYVYHEPPSAIPAATQVIHVDENPWELGKNYPLAVGLQGDTQASLLELGQRLAELRSTEWRGAVMARKLRAKHQQAARQAALREQIQQQVDTRPLEPTVLMDAIARALPDDVAVIEAAVTSTGGTLERLGAIRDPYGYFGQRGWTLGWGLNFAMGVQLAWPDRPVLGVIGDGAAMYGIQGLWTAARYQIPVTWVICNNRQYQILKEGGRGLGLSHAQQGEFIGMDLADPGIDFVRLAESLGVAAKRVADPDELTDELTRSWSTRRPLLVEVEVRS